MAVNSLSLDPRFREAARYIQEGSWKAAIGTLQELLEEYPNQEEEILPLLEHVQMKVSLDQRPVRGRSPLSLQLTRVQWTRLLLLLLLLTTAVAGWFLYQRWLAPTRSGQIQQRQIQLLLEQASTALSQGDYETALQQFTEVLDYTPDNSEARSGQEEAKRQLALTEKYTAALAYQQEGDLEQALSLYQELQNEAPGYRDIERRITELQQSKELENLFRTAETLFQQGRLEEALPYYEQIRQTSSSYQTQTVEQHLYDSYVRLANQKSAGSPASLEEVEAILGLYQQAIRLRPRDTESRTRKQLLEQYLTGVDFASQERYPEAVQLLTGLYQAEPSLLGGQVVETLYETQLAYGAELETSGRIWAAFAQYSAAADLPVADTSEARRRRERVGLALTPTPTPTPSPTPTPTPDPLDEFRKLLLPPPANPIDWYPGWIAFQSDRPGSPTGLWVMRPDGSEQLPVTDPTGLYEHLQEQAKWSSDNMRRIWVEDDGSGKSVAIYMWRYDVPAHWREARVELLNNSAINYQPVFSPDDQAVAFTSQRSGAPGGKNYGDEIFILYFSEINADGYVIPHRLTKNDWEWDKHPTFSPDSQTIAFWSNRDTGRAQIWAMNRDGSNQRNLSNNEWNDWDPVYIVPRREIPEVKKRGDAEITLFDPAKYETETENR